MIKPKSGDCRNGYAKAHLFLQSASKAKEGEMRSKLLSESPKTFALILETGDELLSSIKSFAQEERLSSSSFKAIGALNKAELGWFNWETKKYQTAVKLEEQQSNLKNRSNSCHS